MTYLITGAGKGIGYDTTIELLKQNIKVIAVSRNTNKLKQLNNKCLQIIEADITSQIDYIVKQIGSQNINGIVNNAGLLIKKEIQTLTYDDFQQVYNTNVFAPFNLTMQLKPNLAQNAHILNIGSMGGYQNTAKFPGMIFYSSSKAALHCLSQCLNLELSQNHIYVNCLALGAVQTEMVKEAFPGFNAPITSDKMGRFIAWFLQNGHSFFRGQIIPVELTSM